MNHFPRLKAGLAALALAGALLGCDRSAPPPRVAGTPEERREEVGAAKDLATREPSNPDAHSRLGRAHLAVAEAATALGAFQRALDLNPKSREAREGLAAAFLALGRPFDAANALASLRSQGLEPNAALEALVAGVGAANRPPPSVPAAVAAAPPASPPVPPAPPPANPGARPTDPVVTAFEQGKFDEVIQKLTAVPERDLFQTKVLADALYNAKRFTEAAQQFALVVQQEPGNEQARRFRATALMQAGDFSNAHSAYLELAKRHPDEAGLEVLTGDAAAQLGDSAGAREAYQRARAKGFDSGQLDKRLAELKSSGKPGEAGR